MILPQSVSRIVIYVAHNDQKPEYCMSTLITLDRYIITVVMHKIAL